MGARPNIRRRFERGKLGFELLVHRHMHIAIEFDEVGQQDKRAFNTRSQIELWWR